MRTLLIGKSGQVGSALVATMPALGELIAPDRGQLDLARPDAIRAALRDVRPQVIVNAAAYTAVDQAERDEALALRINRDGPAVLAEEAARLGALLVHFSSDYVFDGEKPSPYVETDAPNPLNAYGRSKLAGDRAIESSGCRHLVLRTSWVYAAHGRNFVLSMLRRARDGERLRVVDDQYGAPTSNLVIAAAAPGLVRQVLADRALEGVYHLTAAGRTTWYDFAHAIFKATGTTAEVSAVASTAYAAPARRPRNSVLDNRKLWERLNIRMPPWQEGLTAVLQALR